MAEWSNRNLAKFPTKSSTSSARTAKRLAQKLLKRLQNTETKPAKMVVPCYSTLLQMKLIVLIEHFSMTISAASTGRYKQKEAARANI